MSRLWRDRLLISLAPDCVAVARVAGGPRRRLVAKQVMDCDPASGETPWQGAVAALESAIAPLRGERVNASVALSNHFVRYAVVPFDAGAAGPEEELALARFHFARIHGDRSRNWDIRMSEAADAAPRLASGVDAGLIDAIRGCFPSDNSIRLASIQPYLMSAFNLWRSVLPEDVWLLLVEPQRVCLTLLNGHGWSFVQTSRGSFPGPEAWAVLLDRQRLRADAAAIPETVHVHSCEGLKELSGEARGWKFLGLTQPPVEGYVPHEEGRLELALSAR